MFKKLFGQPDSQKPDDEKPEARLLLLSKFRRPQATDNKWGIGGESWDDWKEILEASPQAVVRDFVKEDLLEPTATNSLLAAKYKVSELKNLSKGHGLPVSGKKEVLIARLMDYDSAEMERAVEGMEMLQCSEKGRQLADEYLDRETTKKNNHHQELFAMLKEGELEAAIRQRDSFYAAQLFSGGVGVPLEGDFDTGDVKELMRDDDDWDDDDIDRDVAILKYILYHTPSLLKSLESSEIEPLKLAAAMCELRAQGPQEYKEWLPSGHEVNSHIPIKWLINTLGHFGTNMGNMEQWKNGDLVKHVTVGSANDDNGCENCRKQHGAKYEIHSAPELPLVACTSELGCRCGYSPFFEDDEQSDEFDSIDNKAMRNLEEDAEREVLVKKLELNPVCPNCQESLKKKPKRKMNCPHCEESIFVWKGLLLTENQRKVEDEREVEEALEFLAPLFHNEHSQLRAVFDETRIKLSERFGMKAFVGDTIWSMLNGMIMDESDPSKMASIYGLMANWIEKEGKDPTQYLEQQEEMMRRAGE